jgi:peroxiredoxin
MSELPGVEPHAAAAPEPGRRPRPRVRVAAAVVLPIACLAVAVSLLSAGRSPAGDVGVADYSAPPTREDRPAPEFTLPRLVGPGSISLGAGSGQPVVLTFWASWCRPCREEAPFLQAAWRSYGPEGVRFVGVDHRDSRDAARSFERAAAITFPSVFDARGDLSGRYGLVGLPTTFVIGADGRIAYRITGMIDATNLRAALDSVVGSG